MPKVGEANFCFQVLLTTAAVCCSLAATGSCSFAERNVVLAPGSNTTLESICANFAQNECLSYGDLHSVAYFGWQVIVPENQKICLSYTQPTTSGYVTLPVDPKFNGGKWSLIIANCFGLIAFFTLVMSSCCPLDSKKMAGLSCYYFIATFFQGLSFLIYPSVACQEGFFEPFINPNSALTDTTVSVSCSLGLGAKMSISATIMYFICMCTVPFAKPPPPVGNPFEGGGGEGGEGGDDA